MELMVMSLSGINILTFMEIIFEICSVTLFDIWLIFIWLPIIQWYDIELDFSIFYSKSKPCCCYVVIWTSLWQNCYKHKQPRIILHYSETECAVDTVNKITRALLWEKLKGADVFIVRYCGHNSNTFFLFSDISNKQTALTIQKQNCVSRFYH